MTYQQKNTIKQDSQYSEEIAESLKTISQFMDKFNKLMNKQKDLEPQYECMITENDEELKPQTMLLSKTLPRPYPYIKVKNKLSTVYQESITHSQTNLTGMIGAQCLQLAQKSNLLQINQSNIPLMTKNSDNISFSSYISNGNVLKSLNDEKVNNKSKQLTMEKTHIMKKILGIRQSFKFDKENKSIMTSSLQLEKYNQQNFPFPKKIVKIKHKNSTVKNTPQKKSVRINYENKQHNKNQIKNEHSKTSNQFFSVELMKKPPKPKTKQKQRRTSLKECLSRRNSEKNQATQLTRRKGLSVTSSNSLDRNKKANNISKSPKNTWKETVIQFQKLHTHQQKNC